MLEKTDLILLVVFEFSTLYDTLLPILRRSNKRALIRPPDTRFVYKAMALEHVVDATACILEAMFAMPVQKQLDGKDRHWRDRVASAAGVLQDANYFGVADLFLRIATTIVRPMRLYDSGALALSYFSNIWDIIEIDVASSLQKVRES